MSLTNVSDERHCLAVGWHSGQASMLYAIASTGGLTLNGSRRRFMTAQEIEDSEYDLLLSLSCELGALCVEILESGDYNLDDYQTCYNWELEVSKEVERLEERLYSE